MIVVFQAVLITIMSITFIGILGEKEDKKMRNEMTGLCIAAMVSFIITATWL